MSEVLLTPATSEIEELPGMALMEMREPGWNWSKLNEKQRPQRAWTIRDSERGESVAILRIFYRMLVCKERQLRAVGIGGVWTWPARRGRGYATVLLEKTLAKLRVEALSADVVILYSKPRGMYSHSGFIREVAEGLLATSLHGDVMLPEGRVWSINPEGHF